MTQTRSRPSRTERLALREQERQRHHAARARRKWLPWAIAAVLVALGIGGGGAYASLSPIVQPIPGVERITATDRDHVTGTVNYAQSPPIGGPHNPVWQNCGMNDQPVPNEWAVHSMEHGAVWIAYRSDLPMDQVQALRAVARAQEYVLLSLWATDSPLPSPIVASAWGLQLKLDTASNPRLAEFIRRYANGPQTPERMAPCSGGMGTPLQYP